MIGTTLSKALTAILDNWVYRPGLIRLGGAALNVNFAARVKRLRRVNPLTGRAAPVGYTYSTLGLLVPIREFSLSHNIVVNEGLNYLLDTALSGGTPDTTWFVGLTANSPTFAAADTLASHGGWTEFTDYDETNRVAWVDAGVSSQSVSNTASPAQFTSSSDSNSTGGAFLAGVNTGTSGTLYAGAAFSSNKALDTGETIDVTATFTAADDGA